MFNSPILDLAIALSFTYFILGLIVSTVNEAIQARLGKRAKFLRDGITYLFAHTNSNWEELADRIYKSPHIISLKDKRDGDPSYIPPGNFALALIDLLKDTVVRDVNGNKINEIVGLANMNTIRAKLTDPNGVIQGQAREALLSLFERANGDLNQFQKNIEAYFNAAMDRTTGWYKRHAQKWVFGLSVITALVLNVDTIKIAKTLWENPEGLKKSADQISQDVKNIKEKDGTYVIQSGNKTETITTDTVNSAGKPIKTTVTKVTGLADYLKSAQIPMGWHGSFRDEVFGTISVSGCSILDGFLSFLLKLGGISLTAFALLAGSPFWFDMLNKLVNVRNTGKRPDEKDGASSSASGTSPSSTQPVG
jgi:hypothetical protein